MKKIFILFIFIFLFMLRCDFVEAICYKINNSNEIYYSRQRSNDSNVTQSMVEDRFCNFGSNNKVSCGSIGSFNKKIPELTSWFFTLVQIVVPIALVIFGSFDFVKAIIASKEDEIKRGQQIFIKRLITGIIVFFVVAIVKTLVGILNTDDESHNIIECIDCFINNECSSTN